MRKLHACRLCVCTRGYGIIRVCTQICILCTHTAIYSDIYTFSHPELYMQHSTHAHTNTHERIYIDARCRMRRQRNGRRGWWESTSGGGWQLRELFQFISSPGARLFSPSPFPPRPRVSILRPREPLFLHSNRFRSRGDILLEFCHVRASPIKRWEHRWDGKKQVYFKSGRLKTRISSRHCFNSR